MNFLPPLHVRIYGDVKGGGGQQCGAKTGFGMLFPGVLFLVWASAVGRETYMYL